MHKPKRPEIVCDEHLMVVGNTLFKQHEKRKYTWTRSDIERFQINYVPIQGLLRKCLAFAGVAKTLAGADIHSDYNLVLTEVDIK